MFRAVHLMNSRGWNSYRNIENDPALQAETEWLLSLAVAIGATHCSVITELPGLTQEGMAYLFGAVQRAGLQPIIWTSKWAAADDEANEKQLRRLSYAVAHYPGAWYDIFREGDALWLRHGLDAYTVASRVWQQKMVLISAGVDPAHILAGGSTSGGTKLIDSVVGPGITTITGYKWIDESYALFPFDPFGNLGRVAAQALGDLLRTINSAHKLAVIEIGWPALGPSPIYTEDLQAEVIRRLLSVIGNCGGIEGVGVWQLLDFVHCGDDEGYDRCDPSAISYGMVRGDTSPRPALAELLKWSGI